MAKKTTTDLLADGATPMNQKQSNIEITAADIHLLYTLAQQALVKVSEIPQVGAVMEKCSNYFNTLNSKG